MVDLLEDGDRDGLVVGAVCWVAAAAMHAGKITVHHFCYSFTVVCCFLLSLLCAACCCTCTMMVCRDPMAVLQRPHHRGRRRQPRPRSTPRPC